MREAQNSIVPETTLCPTYFFNVKIKDSESHSLTHTASRGWLFFPPLPVKVYHMEKIGKGYGDEYSVLW